MAPVGDRGHQWKCANGQTCCIARNPGGTWNLPHALCLFIYLLALLISVKFRAALLGFLEADTGDCLLSMFCPACRKHQARLS